MNRFWASFTTIGIGAIRELTHRGWDGKDFVAEAEQLLSHVDEDIQNYGIGLISEFYDGNPPYVGHGCISQARNTAEIIRSIYLIQCYREGNTKKM